MSDVKNYIVQYDIRANTEQAATQLRAIMESIAGVEGPMKTLQQTLGTLNSTLTQLKSNQNLAFTPTIDTTSFDRKLKAMQISVKTAADEMAATINRALQGNTAVGKAAKNSLGNVLGPRTAKDIQKDIAAYKEKINQIMGAPDKKTGKRHFAFADLNDEHKAQVKALRQQISNDSKLLKEAEKLERQNAAIQTKSEKTAQKAASKPTVATKAQAARLTNVTPAIIREWGKVFGNTKAKSLTVSIYGKADGPNGAITVINQVKTMLGELGALGKFDIMPKPNAAAFAEIESKLSSLAALSKSVMAPFTGDTTKKQGKSNTLVGLTKDEQKKLEQARASATDYKKKIDDVQRKLYANQQKYDQQPTPALKGQITRGTKLLQQYKLGLSTAQYDIQQLQEKAAPAVQPTTKIAPLTINVVGNLTGVNNVGKEFPVNVIGQIQKLQPPANAEIPVAVKITASQINQSLKAIPRPELPVSIKLMWNKGAIGKQEQLKAIKDKVPPITLQLDTTKAIESLEAFITKVKGSSPQNIALTASTTTAGSGSGSGSKSTNKAASASAGSATKAQVIPGLGKAKPSVSDWLVREQMRRGVELDKMRREAMSAFGQGLTPYEESEYKKAFDEQSKRDAAARKLNTAVHQNKANALKTQIHNSMLPFVQNQSQLNDIIKHRKIFSGIAKMTGFNMASATLPEKLDYLQNVKSQMQIQNAQIPMWLQNEINKLEAERKAGINKAQREVAERNEKTALENRNRRIANRQARISNAVIPFVQNQGQLNAVVKNWKYFQQAMTSTGITPTQGMSAQNMLKYLQGVSQLMRKANVQIPMQLQTAINKLQAQVLQATQAATQLASATTAATKATSKMQTVRVAEKPVSSYDRIRKWAYPFTGNTSFGATTPMAVDMAKGMGVMFAVGGAMSAVGNSFSEAIEYQNTMRTTNAILKNGTDSYTPSAFASMERTVRDVGIKTKFSAPEVASAARFLAMAGFDIEKIKHSIQPIADLALIGDTDLGETADKMTNIMTTFNIAGERVREAVNIMTTTATRSNTDLMMLAESAKYGGGVANLYGKNDPNLFADTMALFGIMGNAGIQASSAGTALRMMYQNIFKPNKNQQAVLNQLDKDYGIKTLKEDGSYRSMSDVLIDIANKVPQNKMAKVVGNLFRITAQPGAAAALNAAAQEDGTDASQVASGVDAVSEFIGKKGLSSLVELMLANRASVTSNISQNIALEKQNTIKGLWAQVTSTFTEGILKAFEANTGYFEEMLGNFRDYLARPETAQLIQKLFDMIVSIGKMMAEFVKVWVWFYEKFEPIVKGWIWAQMFFTQVGSLITPIVGAISVLDRLRSTLLAFSGTASVSAVTNVARQSISTSLVGNAAGNILSYGDVRRKNMPKIRQLNRNIQHQLMLHGMAGAATSELMNYIANGRQNTALAKAVNARDKLVHEFVDAQNRKRSQQMSNPALLSRVASRTINKGGIKNFADGFATAYKAGTAYMSLAGLSSMLASVKTMFTSFIVSLGKIVGVLTSPISLALAAVGGLSYGIFKLGQYADSSTEAQIKARKRLEDSFKSSLNNEKERLRQHYELLAKYGFITINASHSQETDENGEPKKSEFEKNYPHLFNNEITGSGASRKANVDFVQYIKKQYANDATLLAALTEEERKNLLGEGLVVKSQQLDNQIKDLNVNPQVHSWFALGRLVSNWLSDEANSAKDIQYKNTLLAIKSEGAKNSGILQARERIAELRKSLGNTEEFRKQAEAIRDNAANLKKPGLLSDKYITLENLANPNFDITKLHAYVQAGYNVLDNEIKGGIGSIVPSALAMDKLKGNLVPYTQEWYDNIATLVKNFRIIETINHDGKTFSDIELMISTLPSGQLDFSNVQTQIQEKVQGFKANTTLFFELADKVYQNLIGLKAVDDNTNEGIIKWISDNTKNIQLSKDEFNQYYPGELTQNDKNNPAFHLDKERQRIARLNMVREWVNMIYGAIEKNVKNGANGAEGTNGTGTTNTDNPNPNPTSGNGTADPTKQDAYESKYTASAARPTQIVLNIDKMANFDRTTIAANADERDMMLGLEQKIAETVYRILAEAMNNAGSMVRT